MVHVHSSVGLFRFFHILAARILNKRVVVTVHSWRAGFVRSNLWSLFLNSLAHSVVCVSEDVYSKIMTAKRKTSIYPAFLPPVLAHDLPAEIDDFIECSRRANKKIVVSNAFRLVEYNGQDLYGLDICIEAFTNALLREQCVLVFVISDPSYNVEWLKRYQDYLLDKKLQGSILIYPGAVDFFCLVKESDLTVRATNTDGDANSVRESIYLGVPCVASDCTARPDGTVLFESRSPSSLADKILSSLSLRSKPELIPSSDVFFEFYESVYKGR